MRHTTHVTHMNQTHEARHKHGWSIWVTSHAWMKHMRHVTHIYEAHESGDTHVWGTCLASHYLIRHCQKVHLTHVNQEHESCHTYEWGTWVESHTRVTLHYLIKHVTYVYESWHKHACLTWLIHMCDMTHSYVWRDSFICHITLPTSPQGKRRGVAPHTHEWGTWIPCLIHIWTSHVIWMSHATLPTLPHDKPHWCVWVATPHSPLCPIT